MMVSYAIRRINVSMFFSFLLLLLVLFQATTTSFPADDVASTINTNTNCINYVRCNNNSKQQTTTTTTAVRTENTIISQLQPVQDNNVVIGPVAEFHQSMKLLQQLKKQQHKRSLPVGEHQQEQDQQQNYDDDWFVQEEKRYRTILRNKLQQQHEQRRKLLVEEEERTNSTKTTTSSASSNRLSRRLNPSTGTDLRVMVLLVKFSDHIDREVPAKDYYETLFNADGIDDTINPVGSFKEWLRYSSLGRYRVSFTIQDWQVAPNTESYYADGRSGVRDPSELQEIFTSILTDIDNSNAIDFTQGYIDEFGYFNHLVVMHSGYSAEFGTLSCLSGTEQDPLNRINSLGSAALGAGAWTSKDFYTLNGFALLSAFYVPSCNNGVLTTPVNPTRIGMIAHEYSHGFGAVDLYDQDVDEATYVMIGGIDKFGIMANGYGWVRDASKPGIHDPFTRIKIGWLEPIEIVQNGFYSIQASEISGQVYKISTNFPDGEYLLIENRQPLKWDSPIPGGIVIYHVDELALDQSKRGYPGHPNWPTDHYMVSVVQADRLYEIEQGIEMGDAEDFWNIVDQTLGPGGDDPNTDSIQGGTRTETGISITVKSTSGFIMMFEVQGLPDTIRSTNKNITNTTTTTTSQQGQQQSQSRLGGDPRSTRSTVQWILSMLFGSAILIGLIMVVLV